MLKQTKRKEELLEKRGKECEVEVAKKPGSMAFCRRMSIKAGSIKIRIETSCLDSAYLRIDWYKSGFH